ncbi:exosome-associated Rnase, putative [Bodo saltans]|uniref:Exosome-associated Rnase, putative n=1 Tax=Bodo saltans TaxID=75058 RepID=A0A0S4JA55_BODSA|nr:exosome-associated Rnase, putative [Bodo saltans]|eukprot:CUG86807.1 exosome-associated Rnase, putative [Bodo saltans]
MYRTSVSDSEGSHIRNSLLGGVRRDGRGLLEHRVPLVTPGVVPHTDGSCSVDIGGTHVLVNLVVSVAETASGQGELRVHLDCAPSVISSYAQTLGGADNRYRKTFVSWLSNTVSKVFGAEVVAAEEQGLAEAILDDELESESEERNQNRDFPSHALAIGNGYSFVIDADVQISECMGGNVVGATAMCISSALKTVKLPHVTLHETPNGISVEVDKSRSFSGVVDWSVLPTVVVAHWTASTFLVDATFSEEASIPRFLVVASTQSGRVSHWMLQCFPSKQGIQSLGLSPVDLRSLIGDSLLVCDQLRESH